MMRRLSAPCFSAIDIRDAKIELHLPTGEGYLGAFHAYRVGQITADADQLSRALLPGHPRPSWQALTLPGPHPNFATSPWKVPFRAARAWRNAATLLAARRTVGGFRNL